MYGMGSVTCFYGSYEAPCILAKTQDVFNTGDLICGQFSDPPPQPPAPVSKKKKRKEKERKERERERTTRQG